MVKHLTSIGLIFTRPPGPQSVHCIKLSLATMALVRACSAVARKCHKNPSMALQAISWRRPGVGARVAWLRAAPWHAAGHAVARLRPWRGAVARSWLGGGARGH